VPGWGIYCSLAHFFLFQRYEQAMITCPRETLVGIISCDHFVEIWNNEGSENDCCLILYYDGEAIWNSLLHCGQQLQPFEVSLTHCFV